MRSFLCLLFAATFTFGAASHADAHVRPSARWHSCRYQSSNTHRSWTHWEVRKTAVCAADHWHVDFGHLAYIINRESRWDPRAWNSSSGACGLMQWLAYSVWPNVKHYARLNGQPFGDSCKNARSNVLAAAHYIHLHGWSPWAT